MSFVSSYYGKAAVFITKSILGVRKGFKYAGTCLWLGKTTFYHFNNFGIQHHDGANENHGPTMSFGSSHYGESDILM